MTLKTPFTRRGYTIIELTVALGLISVVSILAFMLYQNFIQSSQQRQLSSSRDQVALWIRQNAGNLKNLKHSLKQPGNEQFYNCVCGQGTACTSAKEYPFTLFDVSNPTATPIQSYYDTNGLPCDKNSPSCLIEVKLSFIAQCMPVIPSSDPTPPTICTGVPVEFFGILYTIQQNPLASSKGNLIKTVAGTTFTQTTSLNPPGSGVCP